MLHLTLALVTVLTTASAFAQTPQPVTQPSATPQPNAQAPAPQVPPATPPQQAPPPAHPHHGMHHGKLHGGHHGMAGGDACERCYFEMSQRPSPWTLTFSPAYFHQDRENVNPAFTNNGFSNPRQDLFGWEIEIRKQLESGFQWGVEFLSADTNRENGTNRASYGTGLFGLYLGYRILDRGPFTLDFGTGLGGAQSELEVFSGTQNGRLTESAWYAQPTLGVGFTVSRHFRLGLSASYLAPFGQNEDVVGQDLGVRDIAVQGFSGKIDLILGRFY